MFIHIREILAEIISYVTKHKKCVLTILFMHKALKFIFL